MGEWTDLVDPWYEDPKDRLLKHVGSMPSYTKDDMARPVKIPDRIVPIEPAKPKVSLIERIEKWYAAQGFFARLVKYTKKTIFSECLTGVYLAASILAVCYGMVIWVLPVLISLAIAVFSSLGWWLLPLLVGLFIIVRATFDV